jgi:DNA modification methylase
VINISEITLKQGDCLELMKEIPNSSVDLILCDLPYGTTACKWDTILPFDKLWEQYNRIIKDNGIIVLFGSQPFTSLLGASNIENLKYSWIYQKTKPTNFMNAKKQPLRGFEDILVFYKRQSTYNPQGLIEINKNVKNTGTKNRKSIKENGDLTSVHNPILSGVDYRQQYTNYPTGILTFSNGSSKSYHPTQKPVELLEYLIKTYTNENEIVLDNCMGSGSTGVACVNTNRNFIGFELDNTYFEIAEKRIEDAQNSISQTRCSKWI